MNLLSLIPGASGVEAIVIGSIIALAAGAYALQHHQVTTLKAQLAAEKTGRQADRTAEADAAASAAVANQAETARRIAAQGGIANETQRLADRAHADAAAAVAASVGLRGAASAAAARCSRPSSDTAAPALSAPASAAGVVLADVLGRIDSRAGELAAALDAGFIAGQQCERTYDALTH